MNGQTAGQNCGRGALGAAGGGEAITASVDRKRWVSVLAFLSSCKCVCGCCDMEHGRVAGEGVTRK